jgi:hypothetical protein
MSIIDDLVKNAVDQYAKSIIPICGLGVGVAVIIEFIKTKIKRFKPNLYKNIYFTEIILPITPFLIGCLLSILVKESLLIGFIAGACSGTIYQIIKGYIKKLNKNQMKSND